MRAIIKRIAASADRSEGSKHAPKYINARIQCINTWRETFLKYVFMFVLLIFYIIIPLTPIGRCQVTRRADPATFPVGGLPSRAILERGTRQLHRKIEYRPRFVAIGARDGVGWGGC